MKKVLIVLALLFQNGCEKVETIENSSSYIFAWTKDENGWDSEFLTVINANPKDTKDHPGGVWNLPPTLSERGLEKSDITKSQKRFKEIGESDRYTLKFVKPK